MADIPLIREATVNIFKEKGGQVLPTRIQTRSRWQLNRFCVKLPSTNYHPILVAISLAKEQICFIQILPRRTRFT